MLLLLLLLLVLVVAVMVVVLGVLEEGWVRLESVAVVRLDM